LSGEQTNQPRRSWLDRLWADERGQGIIEYILIVSLVGLGAVIGLGFLSGEIQELFFESGNKLDEATEVLSQPNSGFEGSFPVPEPCIGNLPDVDYTYYHANTVYGPGTESNPLGYEGIYVSEADAVTLGLGILACGLVGVPFPPTTFDLGGYDFTCIWTFDTWRIPGNPSLVLGGRCAVVPSPPANGAVTLAPTPGPHQLGTTLTATQTWSNNPEQFDFMWQRTGQSGSWAADCSNASGWSTYSTTSNSSSNVNTRTPTSAGDANRCYRVVAHASNPAGQSALPDPISNAVRMDLPPAPSGGNVSLAPTGPNPLGTQLVATTGGWANNPTSYTFTWQRTGQSTTWASDCSNGSGWNTYDTNGSNDETDSDTISQSSEGNRCYRVLVTATNAGGTSPSVTSNAVRVDLPPPPAGGFVNLTPTGPVPLNTQLVATTGGWSNPDEYEFNWQRTGQSTSWASDCSNASGWNEYDEDNSDHPDVTENDTPNSSSEGNRCYRVVVIASNIGGDSAPATSNAVRVDLPPPPENTSAPQISGSTVAGSTLTTTNGSWDNGPITDYDYQWQRSCSGGFGCSGGWQNIGSNQNTYTLQTGDIGRNIRVIVNAENIAGNTNATSNTVGPVTAPPPPEPGSMSAITPSGADDGDTMNVDALGFNNSPDLYQFQWEQKNRNGQSDCGDSSGYALYDTNNSGDDDDSTSAQNFFGNGSSNRCYRVRARASNDGGTTWGDWSSYSTPIWVEDD
jgi:Flp pilus assembly pilin Flp